MSFKNLKYCWLLDVIWASYVKISPRKKSRKDLKKKKNRILRETWSGDCACTEGNPRQAPPVRKINFVLLFCAMRKQHVYTCKRVCEMVLSQRRNRRGSFQATPVRTRRSRLSLSLRLSPSLRYGVSSSTYRSYRAEASTTATAPNTFSRQVLSRRGPRV